MIVDHPLQRSGTDANVPLRGVQPRAFQVHTQGQDRRGPGVRAGPNEIVAGRAASRQFTNLTVGSVVKWGENQWTVVGIFEAGGSAAESELWCDAKVLQPAYRRGNTYQSVILRLASHDSFDQLKDALTTDPQLNVTAIREPEYYERQSQTLQTVIRSIGFAIAGLMGIGAIFGAVNTMYNAVHVTTSGRSPPTSVSTAGWSRCSWSRDCSSCVAAVVAEALIPRNPALTPGADGPIMRSLTSWDGWYYLGIVAGGYHVDPVSGAYRDIAFAPLFPLSSGPVGAVAGVCGTRRRSSCRTWHSWLRSDCSRVLGRLPGPARAALAAGLLAIYPFASVFAMAYTESLFLLFMVAAFLAAERRHRTWAGIFLAVTVLSRLQGVGLILPLWILMLRQDGWRPTLVTGLAAARAAGRARLRGVCRGGRGSLTAFLDAQKAWGRERGRWRGARRTVGGEVLVVPGGAAGHAAVVGLPSRVRSRRSDAAGVLADPRCVHRGRVLERIARGGRADHDACVPVRVDPGEPAVVIRAAGLAGGVRRPVHRGRHPVVRWLLGPVTPVVARRGPTAAAVGMIVVTVLAGIGFALGVSMAYFHLTLDPLADVRAYYDAGARLNAGLPLYAQAVDTDAAGFYRYPPLLAIAFRPLALLSYEAAALSGRRSWWSRRCSRSGRSGCGERSSSQRACSPSLSRGR